MISTAPVVDVDPVDRLDRPASLFAIGPWEGIEPRTCVNDQARDVWFSILPGHPLTMPLVFRAELACRGTS